MFSLFGKREKLSLVFDIGTTSVGCGLVATHDSKPPEVLYVTRSYFDQVGSIDPKRLFTSMIESLKAIELKVIKEGIVDAKEKRNISSVSNVHFFISSPWSLSRTKILTVKKDQPVKITKVFIENLLESELKLFTSSIEGATPNANTGLQVLSQKVVDIKLNGYSVDKPYGKLASTIDISIFLSVVPKEVISKIEEITHKMFRHGEMHAAAFPFAAFSVIRDAHRDLDDFMFIDISGPITDISAVRSGSMVENATFPKGHDSMVRIIAKEMSVDIDTALSFIKMYTEGHLDEGKQKTFEEALTKARDDWHVSFDAVVQDMSTRIVAPNTLFLISSNDLASFLMRMLKAERRVLSDGSEIPFDVSFLNHDKMRSLVSFAKGSETDSFIAVAAAFVGRTYSD
jgi:cell division ATPase FtsA